MDEAAEFELSRRFGCCCIISLHGIILVDYMYRFQLEVRTGRNRRFAFRLLATEFD